ncbi:DNA polymerase III subunit chi [Candidatus Cyrtobacter comes]|uniref:DNA polymerase III subunit chi n=1 Tax=Candidatus Cyrtobacter comes TaxID=675776 RepID=A0ABU5L6J2_9RICK|nr:DNA polymerase III subunit chi [Candidatus Cyrtobacter comes]MDZ5761749.1 DNA polymerase III subunit chi [Candidatus Cyrtobacter comes]
MEVSVYILDTLSKTKAMFKLIEKVLEHGSIRAVLLCSSRDEMLMLDDLLWSYSSISFIPHSNIEDEAIYQDNSKIIVTNTLDGYDNGFEVLFSWNNILEVTSRSYKKVIFMYEATQQEYARLHIDTLSSKSEISLRIFKESGGSWSRL